MIEYPTLTALMSGREPGSVKVRAKGEAPSKWCRPMCPRLEGQWFVMWCNGERSILVDDGPWLLVSEDQPAFDMVRLQIAGQVLAALYAEGADDEWDKWPTRHAYALAEADALIKAAKNEA